MWKFERAGPTFLHVVSALQVVSTGGTEDAHAMDGARSVAAAADVAASGGIGRFWYHRCER